MKIDLILNRTGLLSSDDLGILTYNVGMDKQIEWVTCLRITLNLFRYY